MNFEIQWKMGNVLQGLQSLGKVCPEAFGYISWICLPASPFLDTWQSYVEMSEIAEDWLDDQQISGAKFKRWGEEEGNFFLVICQAT